jgi:hypothetical protein
MFVASNGSGEIHECMQPTRSRSMLRLPRACANGCSRQLLATTTTRQLPSRWPNSRLQSMANSASRQNLSNSARRHGRSRQLIGPRQSLPTPQAMPMPPVRWSHHQRGTTSTTKSRSARPVSTGHCPIRHGSASPPSRVQIKVARRRDATSTAPKVPSLGPVSHRLRVCRLWHGS